MTQVFNRSADTWLRFGLFSLMVGLIGGLAVALMFDRSDYRTDRGWVVDQPIPFSHAHHAGELGIDCRYCHASVETSARRVYRRLIPVCPAIRRFGPTATYSNRCVEACVSAFLCTGSESPNCPITFTSIMPCMCRPAWPASVVMDRWIACRC